MGVPTCSECNAKIYWRSRQLAGAEPVALPGPFDQFFAKQLLQAAAGDRGDAQGAA